MAWNWTLLQEMVTFAEDGTVKLRFKIKTWVFVYAAKMVPQVKLKKDVTCIFCYVTVILH